LFIEEGYGAVPEWGEPAASEKAQAQAWAWAYIQ